MEVWRHVLFSISVGYRCGFFGGIITVGTVVRQSLCEEQIETFDGLILASRELSHHWHFLADFELIDTLKWMCLCYLRNITDVKWLEIEFQTKWISFQYLLFNRCAEVTTIFYLTEYVIFFMILGRIVRAANSSFSLAASIGTSYHKILSYQSITLHLDEFAPHTRSHLISPLSVYANDTLNLCILMYPRSTTNSLACRAIDIATSFGGYWTTMNWIFRLANFSFRFYNP